MAKDTEKGKAKVAANILAALEKKAEEAVGTLDALRSGKADGAAVTREQSATGGMVWRESNYREGHLDGPQHTYYADGQFRSTEQYCAGQRTGCWVEYYPGGALRREENYAGGMLNGRCRTMGDNGLPLSEEHYSHGVRDGIQRQWYTTPESLTTSSGKLRSEENYVEGHREGRQITRDAFGNILTEANYTDDKKDGRQMSFERGRPVREENYRDGVPHGVQRQWWVATGNLHYERNYTAGVQDGRQRTFYPDGRLESEQTYRNGEPTGKARELLPNGKRYTEHNYERYQASQGAAPSIDLQQMASRNFETVSAGQTEQSQGLRR